MIEVLRAGIQSTVQDLGRTGLRDQGVARAGAVDPTALQYANLLAGNAPALAALEVTLGPVELCFHSATTIAVTGMPMHATLQSDGTARELQPGCLCSVAAGDSLLLENRFTGGRCYLAVAGGIDVPLVMGSRATDLYAGMGGLAGRSLDKGDRLAIGPAQHQPRAVQSGRARLRPRNPGHIIRALPGQEEQHFDAKTLARFWSSDWQLSPASNRMACRLASAEWQQFCASDDFACDGAVQMRSHAVLPGCIQLPPSGQPVVLLADGQTTGGYPKIAQVIEADLWRLVQMDQRSLFRLVRCTMEEALLARQQQRAALYQFSLASQALYA